LRDCRVVKDQVPCQDIGIISQLGYRINPTWDIFRNKLHLSMYPDRDTILPDIHSGGSTMSADQTTPFGEKLRNLRENASLTQEQLAERAGMHRFSVAKLERGEREPSWATVQALANALDVDCTAFATEDAATATPVEKRGPGRPPKAETPPPAKGKKPGRKRK
jgi:DNA-binding XRE family transcriptional regulator